jgi:uncharacterized protein (TIGR02996 family)
VTSDDEAFVRTIVDRPGDDLPRLVYADWLDERGDERGAYLRAELASPGNIAALATLGKGVDPVWVARVSRPPVGVCCDHVRFCESGPALELADIVKAETRLGCSFPSALTGFLLNYNGGVPSAPWVRTTRRTPIEYGVREFASLGKTRDDSLVCDILSGTLFFRNELELPPKWLLLAVATAEGDELLLSTSGVLAGRIYYWSFIDSGFAPDRLSTLSPNLGALLASLTENGPTD